MEKVKTKAPRLDKKRTIIMMPKALSRMNCKEWHQLNLIYIFMLTIFLLFCSGCNCDKISFIGMTKEQIVKMLEKGPKMKNGSFRMKYKIPDCGNALVVHFHSDKESVLNSDYAMKSDQWQVFFHLDGWSWHSYLLHFKDGVVDKQEERLQPHWTMAEP